MKVGAVGRRLALSAVDEVVGGVGGLPYSLGSPQYSPENDDYIRMTITCLLRQRINDGNNYNKSYMLEFRIRDGSGQCKASVLESNKVT